MKTERLLESVGEEVRKLRTELGISQELLAEKAGLHRNAIGRLERGSLNPTFSTLKSVADKLNTSLSSLIGAAERSIR
jgi:transcriptional regulator with XRE-family HTH domain